MLIKDNEKWDSFLDNASLQYPNEQVIRFIRKSFGKRDPNQVNVLDYGCGVGRNSLAFAKEGFQVYAADYSQYGIEKTIENSKKEGLLIHAYQNSGVELNMIKDDSIDAIFATGVFFHNTKEMIREILKEFKRTLKLRGLYLLIFLRLVTVCMV